MRPHQSGATHTDMCTKEAVEKCMWPQPPYWAQLVTTVDSSRKATAVILWQQVVVSLQCSKYLWSALACTAAFTFFFFFFFLSLVMK